MVLECRSRRIWNGISLRTTVYRFVSHFLCFIAHSSTTFKWFTIFFSALYSYYNFFIPCIFFVLSSIHCLLNGNKYLTEQKYRYSVVIYLQSRDHYCERVCHIFAIRKLEFPFLSFLCTLNVYGSLYYWHNHKPVNERSAKHKHWIIFLVQLSMSFNDITSHPDTKWLRRGMTYMLISKTHFELFHFWIRINSHRCHSSNVTSHSSVHTCSIWFSDSSISLSCPQWRCYTSGLIEVVIIINLSHHPRKREKALDLMRPLGYKRNAHRKVWRFQW